jgi:hypothetical protein
MDWIKDVVDTHLNGHRQGRIFKKLKKIGLLYAENRFIGGKELEIETEIPLDLLTIFPEEKDYVFQYTNGLEIETIVLYKSEMKFYKVINRAQFINPPKSSLKTQRQFLPDDNVDFVSKNAGDYIFIESYPEIIEETKVNLHYEDPFPIVVNKVKVPLEGSKEATIILIDTD